MSKQLYVVGTSLDFTLRVMADSAEQACAVTRAALDRIEAALASRESECEHASALEKQIELADTSIKQLECELRAEREQNELGATILRSARFEEEGVILNESALLKWLAAERARKGEAR